MTLPSPHRAVFLDRDGVLNQAIVVDGKPYPPRTLEELDITDDSVEGCHLLKAAGFKLICVTNQPDVARGKMNASVLMEINRAVMTKLALDDLLFCPHSDEDGCDCRKPKPGLILSAAAIHGIDLSNSYMVGDRWRDIDAGLAAGCRTVFIDRQYDERRPTAMSYLCDTLVSAARLIIDDRLDDIHPDPRRFHEDAPNA